VTVTFDISVLGRISFLGRMMYVRVLRTVFLGIQQWLLQNLVYVFFWKVEIVTYHWGLFFKKNSAVAVVKANLCLFWKVEIVTYYQGPFSKGI